MSVLAALFCCCGPRRAASQAEPDERTRLIPPVEDPTPTQRHVVDQERMKERLNIIVRAKEGKMVNLQAPLPFNLHNAAFARSASRASIPPSLNDDEASQSASSLSIPADDTPEPDEPTRPPLSVRLVRATPALRGRSSARRISPSTAANTNSTKSPNAAEDADVAEPGPSTAAHAFSIQPVGSLSRSWGD